MILKRKKCGSSNISTRYADKGAQVDYLTKGFTDTKSNIYGFPWFESIKEHLRRHCKNCHYEWCDDCLDNMEV